MPTRPGFHASATFDDYPRAFDRAIRLIGTRFYITRSFKKETVGNSEYWGLLARPSDEFSVHLNADRELLFVFSNYESFEIRTLEAFDEFYFSLEQKRVDRSIRFLVSADPRIEEIIQHYLSQNPEYPVIIPILLPSMKDDGDQILRAIRRNYLLRDLFGYQNPLREETFFFGRQEQVNAVLDLAKSGQSSSIFGLRKSGKTSSIYAIMRRAKAFDIVPIFVDCQSPAVHSRRYNELLAYILTQVRKSVGMTRAAEELQGSDATVAEEFNGQLKSIINQSKSRILIVFDEIENISPGTAASGHWEKGRDSLLFWQNIRSFIQQETGGRLVVCLVGTSPLLLESPEMDGVANPMYLFSQKRFIPTFSFDETREMIDRLGFFMGVEIDAVKIAELHKLYGGHPFFIRQVCSNIHKNVGAARPVRISDFQLRRAVDEFGGQLESYLAEILKSLRSFYPSEFRLLEAVAKGDAEEISEYGREAPDLVDHLIGYGLIERNGEMFDIRFEAIKHALRRVLAAPSVEGLWTECMLRRNRVEVDIRRELFIFSKELSDTEWNSVVKSNLSVRRFENLPSIEPRVLFSRKSSPLYWTDLLMFLKSEEVLRHLGSRRRDILVAMEVVNRYGRKDGHANEMTMADVDGVRKALSVLESEFQQPD